MWTVTPHKFKAEGDFVSRLDRPERRKAIPPSDVIQRMNVSKKDVLLDLGAGIGYFSIPLSAKVRAVIAVDSEPKMLEVLGQRAARRRRDNIRTLVGEALSLPVPDGSVDRVFLAFVYHELPLPALVLEECSRVLGPKGRLTVVEFQKWDTPFGPPVHDRKPPEHVEKRAKKRFWMEAHYSEAVYYQLEFRKL
ncbi:MAG TPA: methyltransferase domain-containing protein [Thermoplasmata archaeon]|nr:methyltransferase domain-containing protein [Thermoplasmata archaeon]